jgi:transcriptional regulator with XRE-family HTH domain
MKLKKMPKLSERLKYIRNSYNLSQVELAEKARTTQQAIQQAEKGKARQPRYLHRLAQELEISVDWLILGEVEQSDLSAKPQKLNGLNDKSSEVLDSFFSMPEKDQNLIYELMQSRKDK